MSNSGNIFNVPEPKGRDLVGLETTAANAQVEAPTSSIAREVEANADHAKDVIRDAASTAQSKRRSLTGNPPSALDQFQQQASKTLNDAVAQGQHDVEAVKSTTGGEYVDQAKVLAASAISTAQSYFPESVGGQARSANGTSGPSVVASLQSGAASALETTKEYLAAAQETAQPHIENVKGVAQGFLGTTGTQGTSDTHGKPPVPSKDVPATNPPLKSAGGQAKSANGNSGPGVVASLQSGAASALETTKEYLAAAQETAQPHIENAKGVAQGFLGTTGTQGMNTHGNPPVPPKDIPATSAPLESGGRSFNTPYSSTMSTNVGRNSKD